MSEVEFMLDYARAARCGFGEAVYAEGKSPAQVAAILEDAAARGASLLLTRLHEPAFAALPPRQQRAIDYDAVSRTGFFGAPAPLRGRVQTAVVCAGTSDVAVAREALRTLRFHGVPAMAAFDIGVAGLWRLLDRVEALRPMRAVIAVAGMDAALPTVLAGLIPGCVIAVPTSVGYGVAAGGRAALGAILASCAAGIVAVNIDNGFGAACAALRVLGPRTEEDNAWTGADSS